MNEVDLYISNYPDNVREILVRIRAIILHIAPDAIEGFAYNMPSYKLNGKPLVYFAAYKTHIGFYATPSGHERFSKILSQYKQGKGSVQFPFEESFPYHIIEEIVAFRVSENR